MSGEGTDGGGGGASHGAEDPGATEGPRAAKAPLRCPAGTGGGAGGQGVADDVSSQGGGGFPVAHAGRSGGDGVPGGKGVEDDVGTGGPGTGASGCPGGGAGGPGGQGVEDGGASACLLRGGTSVLVERTSSVQQPGGDDVTGNPTSGAAPAAPHGGRSQEEQAFTGSGRLKGNVYSRGQNNKQKRTVVREKQPATHKTA
ncbi:glycine-rich protein DOT1 [Sorghum bicolor]|nr:glycine-rich protein DOT1 [Sorghum bicolor]|eukprot:XP_002438382.2 glycine-rich protein DOT1 [Sorghum bicolor]